MYEVYALKYGERDTTACQFFYREPSHEPITLHYYVWLILGGSHPILVDTGFLDDDARERGIRGYVSPAAMVERAGVKPGDVPVALITHLHYDHWAGHSLFPGAEVLDPAGRGGLLDGAVRPLSGVPAVGERRRAGAAGDAELCEPGPDHRRRPPGAPGDRRAPRRRPHRGAPDRHGPDPTRDGRAHLRRLALLSQRGDAPARPDHHEPARDARGLRDDPRARRRPSG